MSAKKADSVENIILKIDTINELSISWDGAKFRSQFGTISTVWQVYLMHIIQPDRFPIFDQHVYRAYAYLAFGKADELKGTINKQLLLYADYQAFSDLIQQNCPI